MDKLEELEERFNEIDFDKYVLKIDNGIIVFLICFYIYLFAQIVRWFVC